MLSTRRATLAPLVLVGLTATAALGACSSGAPAAKGGSSSTSAPTTATSSAPSSPTSSTSSTTTEAVAAPRTAAELKKALLELSDLPSGFAVEPPSNSGGGPKASSTDPRCAAFVRLSNADTAPGGKAHAEISFSGGQSGPFIDEALDAFADPRKVAALQAQSKAAIASCSKVTLSVPGAGTSVVTVRPVSPPAYGDTPVAARMNATGGTLDGLEITVVTTGVGDTVAALSFVGATPDDIDGATSAAVDKATQLLGVAPQATS
jgi:hypothetical protein